MISSGSRLNEFQESPPLDASAGEVQRILHDLWNVAAANMGSNLDPSGAPNFNDLLNRDEQTQLRKVLDGLPPADASRPALYDITLILEQALQRNAAPRSLLDALDAAYARAATALRLADSPVEGVHGQDVALEARSSEGDANDRSDADSNKTQKVRRSREKPEGPVIDIESWTPQMQDCAARWKAWALEGVEGQQRQAAYDRVIKSIGSDSLSLNFAGLTFEGLPKSLADCLPPQMAVVRIPGSVRLTPNCISELQQLRQNLRIVLTSDSLPGREINRIEKEMGSKGWKGPKFEFHAGLPSSFMREPDPHQMNAANARRNEQVPRRYGHPLYDGDTTIRGKLSALAQIQSSNHCGPVVTRLAKPRGQKEYELMLIWFLGPNTNNRLPDKYIQALEQTLRCFQDGSVRGAGKPGEAKVSLLMDVSTFLRAEDKLCELCRRYGDVFEINFAHEQTYWHPGIQRLHENYFKLSTIAGNPSHASDFYRVAQAARLPQPCDIVVYMDFDDLEANHKELGGIAFSEKLSAFFDPGCYQYVGNGEGRLRAPRTADERDALDTSAIIAMDRDDGFNVNVLLLRPRAPAMGSNLDHWVEHAYHFSGDLAAFGRSPESSSKARWAALNDHLNLDRVAHQIDVGPGFAVPLTKFRAVHPIPSASAKQWLVETAHLYLGAAWHNAAKEKIARTKQEHPHHFLHVFDKHKVDFVETLKFLDRYANQVNKVGNPIFPPPSPLQALQAETPMGFDAVMMVMDVLRQLPKAPEQYSFELDRMTRYLTAANRNQSLSDAMKGQRLNHRTFVEDFVRIRRYLIATFDLAKDLDEDRPSPFTTRTLSGLRPG